MSNETPRRFTLTAKLLKRFKVSKDHMAHVSSVPGEPNLLAIHASNYPSIVVEINDKTDDELADELAALCFQRWDEGEQSFDKLSREWGPILSAIIIRTGVPVLTVPVFNNDNLMMIMLLIDLHENQPPATTLVVDITSDLPRGSEGWIAEVADKAAEVIDRYRHIIEVNGW